MTAYKDETGTERDGDKHVKGGMANALHLNNKSVELLRAKFQPNTNLSPEALKKFFSSPKRDKMNAKMRRTHHSTAQGLGSQIKVIDLNDNKNVTS